MCFVIFLIVMFPAGASACGWWGENQDETNEEAIVVPGVVELVAPYSPEGMAKMSRAYRLGLNVPQDDTLARNWAKRAAQAGHLGAMSDFAQYLEDGVGGPVDLAESVKWYRNAADLGVVSAQHSLANMYFDGRGVVRDNAKGVMWLRRAAGAQHRAALTQLADLIWQGRIPAQYPLEACFLWQLALQNGLQDDPERCRKEQPDMTASAMVNIAESALAAEPIVWRK